MDYQKRATPKFPTGHSSGKIVVVGVDQREYLIRKEINPRYVGVFRDLMVAIPYHWTTKSGNAVADDLAINTAKGLQEAGYRAEAIKNPNIESVTAGIDSARAAGASKILLIHVNELESDTQWRTEFGYDLTFELLSKSGKVLASNRMKNTIMIGASPLPTITAKIKVPTKVGEVTTEGVNPLLKSL